MINGSTIGMIISIPFIILMTTLAHIFYAPFWLGFSIGMIILIMGAIGGAIIGGDA